MKLIDLSALNRLVDELNTQAASAIKAKDQPLEYIAELSKMSGILTMIHHESSLLSSELIKAYGESSAEALSAGKSVTKSNTGLGSLVEVLSESVKNSKKN